MGWAPSFWMAMDTAPSWLTTETAISSPASRSRACASVVLKAVYFMCNSREVPMTLPL